MTVRLVAPAYCNLQPYQCENLSRTGYSGSSKVAKPRGVGRGARVAVAVVCWFAVGCASDASTVEVTSPVEAGVTSAAVDSPAVGCASVVEVSSPVGVMVISAVGVGPLISIACHALR